CVDPAHQALTRTPMPARPDGFLADDRDFRHHVIPCNRSKKLTMIQATPIPKPRLLVLDEDRIILQSLSQFLRREGYEVRTTDNSDAAMSILESQQIELLLADINMPGVKPADFLREIRKRFPHVVIIVITGYG